METDWWAAYANTHLDLTLPGGDVRRLEQVPGTSGGDQWPFLEGHAWIVTACNPRSVVLSVEENQARDWALGVQLERAGLVYHRNRGFDPGDERWSEVGYTLPGADAVAVMAIAREWEQNAVFAWYPSRWRIVGVLLEGERAHGWRWSHANPAPADG